MDGGSAKRAEVTTDSRHQPVHEVRLAWVRWIPGHSAQGERLAGETIHRQGEQCLVATQIDEAVFVAETGSEQRFCRPAAGKPR